MVVLLSAVRFLETEEFTVTPTKMMFRYFTLHRWEENYSYQLVRHLVNVLRLLQVCLGKVDIVHDWNHHPLRNFWWIDLQRLKVHCFHSLN